jgi:hypothetical protein
MKKAPFTNLTAAAVERAARPHVRSKPLFCRCGAPLIESSNGHYACSYVQSVEQKRQNAPRQPEPASGDRLHADVGTLDRKEA